MADGINSTTTEPAAASTEEAHPHRTDIRPLESHEFLAYFPLVMASFHIIWKKPTHLFSR